MRCRQLRKKLGRLAAIVVVAGLVWRMILNTHPTPPEPQGEQILPADDHDQSAKKNAAIPPVTRRAKALFVEQGVTCASGGGPTEGRVFHLSAANVTAEACVQRCRVEDACAIFTWVLVAGGEVGVGNCWYRIGGRKGTWLARHAATNAVSGCSTDAVVGCDCAVFKGAASNTAYRNSWAVWACRRLSPAVVIFHAAAQQRCSEDRVLCTILG